MALAGIAIVTLVAIRIGQSILDASKRQNLVRERVSVSTQILKEQLAAAKAKRIRNEQQQHSWSGYRKFRVAKKVLEADDIWSFYLVPHDGKPLPEFRPGQFLTFKFELPDTKTDQFNTVIRCYSLSDAPNEKYFRVTIKRVPAPRGEDVPSGLVSAHFIDNVAVADILDVQAPRGEFALDPHDASPVVLIGGGVGLTPVLSMANAILATGSSRPVWFFYGVRCGREHAMKTHLQQLAARHDNFHLHVCYSSPESSDIAGDDYDSTGWLDVETIRGAIEVSNFDFYICGPPPMMASLEPAMETWGVPKDRIFTEAFGPAASAKVKKTSAEAKPAAASETKFSVQFAKSNKTQQWNGSAGSLLDFAEQHGVRIESGCRAGSCGTCSIAVKSGSISSTAECEQGSCLTCVAVPTSDLVLDA